MEKHFLSRPAYVLYEDDGAHCSVLCPFMRQNDGSRSKCLLWDIDLIDADQGPVVHPLCRESRIEDSLVSVMDAHSKRMEAVLRENAELKASIGHGIYCSAENPEECGRSQIICTKGGHCEKQIKENGLRCQGFEGPCMRMDAKRRRQKTQYTDEERNWATYCPACQKGADEHWQERWDDYYGGRL